MQISIKHALSVYVNDKGTLFCLVYKKRNVEKSLPIDLFYLMYEDEKTAREASDMFFNDIDVRIGIVEKAEKRYKIEKEEKSFQRNGWNRRRALKDNLKKGFRKICDWQMFIPRNDDEDNFKNGWEGPQLDGSRLKFVSNRIIQVDVNQEA